MNRSEVTYFELRNDSTDTDGVGRQASITIITYPSFYRPPDTPSVADVPDDIRRALLRWLGAE